MPCRDHATPVLRSGARVALALAVCLIAPGAVVAGGAQADQILRPQAAVTEILRVDRVIRLELELPVEPEVAYDAWTDASQLVEWLPHWAEMTVAEDSGFEMGWEGYDGVWTGTYLEVDRPEALAFTWLPPESVFPAGSYETEVRIRFEPREEGGTLLLLEHSGFRDTPEMEAQLQAWRPYLFALRAFLLQMPASG
ncbi:MAG: SRPBCC family protein [Acidobacteriota bacterium]